MEKYYLFVSQNWQQVVTLISLMALFCLPFIYFVRKFVFMIVKLLFSKYIDHDIKILKKFNVYRFLLYCSLSVYLIFWNNIFNTLNFFNPVINNIKDISIATYTTISFTLLLVSIINVVVFLYKDVAHNKHIPLSLHTQILKTIIIVCAVIIIISYILDISLKAFFTSLGAAAALLTFIFKDTLTNLLASIHLTSQDIVNIGEKISVPQYNIEGIVEAITITIVTIKNDDNTISTISPALLLSTNIKNSRGIQEFGSKRILRSIYIDMNSIQYCSGEFLKHMEELSYFSEEIIKKLKEEYKGNITNIRMFRSYIEEYLKCNDQIHQQNFPIIVRELNPIPPANLPIELCVFTKMVEAPQYEKLQADILDHLISILPSFGLRLPKL